MLKILFQAAARLPLPVLHRIGGLLGRAAYYAAPPVREKVRRHLQMAGLPYDKRAVQGVLAETAKGGLELPLAFFRQPEQISRLFTAVHGWQHIEDALEQRQGLLLLTPHLGSYDLAGRYLSEHLPFPLTAMYKPPKMRVLDGIMQAGRVRGNGRTAPTTAQGVKQLLKALRGGEAVVLLPDHVPDPSEGGGVWARFFGHEAYTMTLAARLARMKQVRTLWFVGERLADGRGFVLHIEPFSGSLNGDARHDAEAVNAGAESLIRRFPEQYLFAYNRYKHPAGAPPRPES